MRKRNYVKIQRGSWMPRDKKWLILPGVLLGCLALYLLASFILGEMGVVKYYRMKTQYGAIGGEIAKLRQDNVRLIREVRSLKTDPAYIERIARDKLGLARPGEIVYYYGDPQ